MFKIIPILMGVLISYGLAVILNACGITNPDGTAILDFASVSGAGWIGLPQFQICKFDITAILVMAPIGHCNDDGTCRRYGPPFPLQSEKILLKNQVCTVP